VVPVLADGLYRRINWGIEPKVFCVSGVFQQFAVYVAAIDTQV